MSTKKSPVHVHESELKVRHTEGEKTSLNQTKTDFNEKTSIKEFESKRSEENPASKAVAQKLMVNKFREAFARIVEQT